MYTFSGTFSSKPSTGKEIARQTAEIEDLRKKLNRETEEKTILQDEMARKDALLQNIKEPTQSNREGIISYYNYVTNKYFIPVLRTVCIHY